MKTYSIKATLRGVSPMIWRRIQIAGIISLVSLQAIIRVAQDYDKDPLHLESMQKIIKFSKINVTHALSQLKDNIVRFLMGISIGGLSRLMIEKISQVTNAYRPDRKLERSHSRMNKDKYPAAYKRMC